jgi:hypothetical protein
VRRGSQEAYEAQYNAALFFTSVAVMQVSRFLTVLLRVPSYSTLLVVMHICFLQSKGVCVETMITPFCSPLLFFR